MLRPNPIILYVEDDAKSRTIVKILFEKIMGYSNLTIFADSEDFQTRITGLDPKPNVIFLDIQIHPLDGFEMLKILRQNDTYRDAIVIAMTANVMSHDVEKLKEIGFDGLIGKPLVKAAFPELVERIIKGESVWFIP